MQMTRLKLTKLRFGLDRLAQWAATYSHLQSMADVRDLARQACDDIEEMLPVDDVELAAMAEAYYAEAVA